MSLKSFEKIAKEIYKHYEINGDIKEDTTGNDEYGSQIESLRKSVNNMYNKLLANKDSPYYKFYEFQIKKFEESIAENDNETENPRDMFITRLFLALFPSLNKERDSDRQRVDNLMKNNIDYNIDFLYDVVDNDNIVDKFLSRVEFFHDYMISKEKLQVEEFKLPQEEVSKDLNNSLKSVFKKERATHNILIKNADTINKINIIDVNNKIDIIDIADTDIKSKSKKLETKDCKMLQEIYSVQVRSHYRHFLLYDCFEDAVTSIIKTDISLNTEIFSRVNPILFNYTCDYIDYYIANPRICNPYYAFDCETRKYLVSTYSECLDKKMVYYLTIANCNGVIFSFELKQVFEKYIEKVDSIKKICTQLFKKTLNYKKNSNYIYYGYLGGYFNFVNSVFMHSCNYMVIVNPFLGKEEKITFLNNLCNKIETMEIPSYSTEKAINVNVLEAFCIFVTYIKIWRVREKEIEINSKLLKQDIKNVPQQYKCKKNYTINNEKINDKLFKILRDILTEGETSKFSNMENFVEKYNETYKYINFFNKFMARTASPNSIFDLKVYFRELYVDTELGEKARKTYTVMREYFDNLEERKTNVTNFKNTEECMFIQSKITRGNYRESDKLEEGRILCEIQQLLARKLYPIFFSFDFDTVMNDLHDISCQLSTYLAKEFKSLIRY